jgi:hypothetical protein
LNVKLSKRVLATSTGTCAVCRETAPLRLLETRRKRGVADLLSTDFDEAATRTVTCQRCFSTYPVRSADASPQGAGRRLRPARTGRDWAYPSAA